MQYLSQRYGPLRLFLLLISTCITLSSISSLPRAQAVDIPRWFYYGQTADQVGHLTSQYNARLTVVRVQDPSVPTFDITMVENTGDFSSAWWWYYGVDAETVGQLLSNKRLISIDPYWTPAGLRFAVVMVPNDGAQGRAWWWYYGVEMTQVGNFLNQNNARLVALRPYNDNGVKFAVIMISNTNNDFRDWEWWVNVTPSFITGRINAGFRVTSFAPNPSGNWDVILVQHENESWWWWYGLDPGNVLSNMGSHDSRLIDVSPYQVNGVWKYAIVELGDSNPPQVGSEI
jgi:hypothetical protein